MGKSMTATQQAPPPPDPTDAALVATAADGDPAAFAALHGRYAAMVHGILLARVSVQDADDLVQDVFLTAFRRLGDLRRGEAFGGWLAQIARNRAIDHHRTRRPWVSLRGLGLIWRPPPSAEVRQVLDAVASLPEAYRETLILRLVEGMTGPEIAEKTGLTPGSVRVNLHRGMGLLRQRLGVEAP